LGALPSLVTRIWNTGVVGRHSASDDEDQDVSSAPSVAAPPRPARHSQGGQPGAGAASTETTDKIGPKPVPRPAEDDRAPPQPALPPPVEPVEATEAVRQDALPTAPQEPVPADIPLADSLLSEPAAAAPPEAAKRKPQIGRGNQSTAADLALLRQHSDVRARVVAAIVAPFVLYTAVLLLIGAMNLYLIWVWVPLVTAGVVAGSILDAEHRRRQHAASDP
jgi:hypothetical protein